MSPDKKEKDFLKTLNLYDAIAILAGAMIGSGIFVVSSHMAQEVNNTSLLLLVWLVSGIMTIIGALSYGEFSASLPHAGGQYIYLKETWGKITGFLYGWSLFLVIQTGAIAAVAVAFAKFLGGLCPGISSSLPLFYIYKLPISSQQLIAIGLIILLTFVNVFGVKLASKIQNFISATNIIALAGIIISGLFIGFNTEVLNLNLSAPINMPSFDINIFSVVAIALVGGVFAFEGWNNLTFVAAEIKNTKRNLPLALIAGTGLVIFLYLLTNIAYISVLSIDQVKNAQDGIIGAVFMQTIFGDYGKLIISIIIMIAAFGCVNSTILSGARVLYAMAKDKLFFANMSRLGKKSNAPENALYLQGLWSIVLVVSGTFSQLLDYLVFAALLFYTLTVGGLFIFRKKYPDIERPYKALGYPYLPIIYCVVSIFVEINLLIYKPMYTWPGFLIVLTGIPVYMYWQKLNKKQITK